MARKPIALSWSSGKDSAWALKRLRERDDVEVVALITSYSGLDRRVPIQYTRIELVLAQARRVGLPIITTPLPSPCSNVEYESAINLAYMEASASYDIDGIAFADIHLQDIRDYREHLMGIIGLNPYFPLWGEDPRTLAKEMIHGGQLTWISAVDTTRLGASFAGRPYDEQFLLDLPDGIDPCGEYGEFHTLAWGGPVFQGDMDLRRGEQLVQGNYAYQDFIPAGEDIGLTRELGPADTSKMTAVEMQEAQTKHMERPAVVRASRVDLPSIGCIPPTEAAS